MTAVASANEVGVIAGERAIIGAGEAGVSGRLLLNRGATRVVFGDKGKNSCGTAIVNWAHGCGVQARLTAPGKPSWNARTKSFNDTPAHLVPQQARIPRSAEGIRRDQVVAA